jgi:hypothetical protein
MEKWERIVSAWDAGEEHQKAYCQRLGININTFSYVRGKLLKKDKVKSKFIPITLNRIDEAKKEAPPYIILENPRGFKLHISPTLSLEQLSKIFQLSGW